MGGEGEQIRNASEDRRKVVLKQLHKIGKIFHLTPRSTVYISFLRIEKLQIGPQVAMIEYHLQLGPW